MPASGVGKSEAAVALNEFLDPAAGNTFMFLDKVLVDIGHLPILCFAPRSLALHLGFQDALAGFRQDGILCSSWIHCMDDGMT